MAKPLRIDAAQARQKTHAGEALLVCAYQDEEKCRWLRLEGAMTLDEFRSRLERLAPEQEVIFYCTWPHEQTSARRAEQYADRFEVRALLGGVDAWKKSGYPLAAETEPENPEGLDQEEERPGAA